jgi:hypothetical protein
MKKFRATKSFMLKDKVVKAGTLLKLPESAVSLLAGMVEPVEDSLPETTRAWLENGELRTRGYIPDLAGEIVRLTQGNLDLQKALLMRHCEHYDHHHIWRLQEAWEERAAIMQYDGGLSREDAEIKAAACLHLTAFLNDLRGDKKQAA